MARLTRVHQKVFASNASNNGVFGSLQAGNPQTSNDVATLQSLSAFENGWDDAIEQGDKLPPLEEFQGIQYGISYQQAYMLQEGIAEWNASTPYYKGSLTKTISGTSFKLYCSLADNNTNKVVTNTSYWKKVMDSDDLYAYDSAVVHNTGNETIAGTKTFSSTISGSITGNAGTVTNGVYTNTEQTISGNKTLTGDTVFEGSATFNQTVNANIDGKAPKDGNGNNIVDTYATKNELSSVIRPGFIIPYGGSTAPSGWLICDGAAVSRTTYADLFAVIGTAYGTGDGSTTFNLPNINNIVKNVNTTVSIKGTGKTLGLTNGSKTFGVRNGGDAGLYGYTGLYNVDVGTSSSGSQVTTNSGVGVTTDASKSGLTGTLSRTNFSCKFIIKF